MPDIISIKRLTFVLVLFMLPLTAFADCSFSIDDPTQGFEGGSGANIITFTVTKTGNSACSTLFSTSDQTATGANQCGANVDYGSLINGALNFSATETSKTIAITTCGDGIDEPDETFVINLFSPSAGATYSKNQGRGTLVDDDSQPEVRINAASVSEGNAGQANLNMNVTLSTASAFTVTVDFATAANTATAGSNCGGNTDFITTSGTVTFNPLTTNPRSVSVPICGDTAIESNETLRVNLSNASQASIGSNQATGTITNDDTQPNLSINDITINERDASQANASFAVSISAAPTNNVTVNYATAAVGNTSPGQSCGNGTIDFVTTNGQLTFNAGSTNSQTIHVPICGDTGVEANEQFRVNLTNATNANIGDNQGQGTITNDDLPTVSVTPLQQVEGTSFGLPTPRAANVTITLSAANPNGATITCAVAELPKNPNIKSASGGASCATGIDFIQAKSQKITFGPTDTVRTCTVNICQDSVDESDEGFKVVLSNPQGIRISTSLTGTVEGGVLIRDDD